MCGRRALVRGLYLQKNPLALSMQLDTSLNMTPVRKLNLQATEKDDFSAWLIRAAAHWPQCLVSS